jgi:cytochrome c-type biogenesis protein CcmH/NrfF
VIVVPRLRRAAAVTLLAPALVIAFALGSGLVPAARANDAASGTQADPGRAITSQLICPCSCGEILSGCTCETGIALKGYVDRELKAGKDRKAIEASLIAKYGEVILGAPKAKGFNLVVWVAPFVATLIGFGIATMVLLRWVRTKRAVAVASGGSAASTGTAPDPALEQLRARAEAELREMKG